MAKPQKKSGVIDKTYIEPGTGRRFHSLVVVERYLTEANEEVPLKALMPTNKPSKLNIGMPPRGPGGNMWNPVRNDFYGPDSVKQSWSESFKSSISGGNISAPSL
ncbi:hypothetical protein DVH24_032785 [Malus domestica]|uniref:Uncharacterized protein n=1 Tax=Malus domestica TaxID=3750 RepID=A0A498ISS3_MALDO|nr:hypothetical protein DVH24_032785 [Malus domestica]